MVQFQPDAKGPLTGVRVLDLTRVVAGNFLTGLLADFGADVIKIEQPVSGDPLRDWRVNGVSTHWKVYSRNKRSVALNLKSLVGREILLDMVSEAQVLVENFRVGTLEQLGIGPDVLLAKNPKLVILRVSGWGQTGPYKDRAGFGTLIESMSGFSWRNGFPDSAPLLPPVPLADMIAGLYGATAIMIALRQCEVSSGGGQVIDLSLLEGLFSFMSCELATYQLTGQLKQRSGNRSSTSAPRNMYITRDGCWLSLSASTQAMTEKLFRILELEPLIEDPRFRTNSDRLQNVQVLDVLVQGAIVRWTLDENLERMNQAGVAAAPVYDIAQFRADPHVQDREIVVEVPDPDLAEPFPMHNVFPRFSVTPGALRLPAPHLGEHTVSVLRDLGYDDARIQNLIEAKVLGISNRKG